MPRGFRSNRTKLGFQIGNKVNKGRKWTDTQRRKLVKVHLGYGFTEKLNEQLRRCWEYIQWRQKILNRYKKCLLCNSIKNLQVDHFPISFADWVYKWMRKLGKNDFFSIVKTKKGFWKIEGRTLCKDCHKNQFNNACRRFRRKSRVEVIQSSPEAVGDSDSSGEV